MAGGEGRASSSGAMCVQGVSPGATGCSGRLSFSSGSSRLGNSGAFCVSSGVGQRGAGAVRMAVGSGTSGSGGWHCFLLVKARARVVAVFSLAQERAQQQVVA